MESGELIIGKKNLLKEKSFAFVLRIVHLYKYLRTNHKEFALSKQILISGTSIGAQIRESENAAREKDFLNKLTVAPEANETHYWLDLLYQSNFLETKLYNSLNKDCNEIISMLVTSVKTLKIKNAIILHSPFSILH